MTIVTNLYGGPGIGKSTLAAELFIHWKKLHVRTELIPEFAKWATYEGRLSSLDQDYITAKQHHVQRVFMQDMEVVTTDSPLLLPLFYISPDYNPGFKQHIEATYNKYNNINVMLLRSDTWQYQEYGRNQQLSEAIELDHRIMAYFNYHKIPYVAYRVGVDPIDVIIDAVNERRPPQE